jgi:hypothetical protein
VPAIFRILLGQYTRSTAAMLAVTLIISLLCERVHGETAFIGPRDPVDNSATCNESEIFANMRWFHDDASRSSRSAWVQGRILRASSVSQVGNVTAIKAAYKDGQQHNGGAASLIDQCDDLTVGTIAYKYAETVARLRTCGDPQPAASATCTDVAENIRWSLLDNRDCSVYARQFLSDAMQTDEYKKVRAERVRRAVQVAEGHRPDIAKSVDFISDDLLLQIATKVYRDYQVDRLDRRPADPSNPFTTQACPGVLLAHKFD